MTTGQGRFRQHAGIHVVHTLGGIAERLGGPSRTVTSLCTSIGQLGVDVNLVAGYVSSASEKLIRPDEARVGLSLVDSLAIGRLNLYPEFVGTLKRLLDGSAQPTLIHDHGIWGTTNIAAWWASRARRVPYVLSPRGMLEPWALGFKARKKKLAWLLYQRRVVASSAVVMATSELECQSVKRLFPNIPVAVIPNGVEMPALDSPHPTQAMAGRRSTVLFMSRIHPKKNLVALLHAWKSLPIELSANWRLRIAGPDEGGYSLQIKSLIGELRLNEAIELVGPVSEVDKAAVYRTANIFVLPSLSENFGVVVAEALAHGLPVIATMGTPWQELQSRGCGWWVKPDPASLAGALTKAMSCSDGERFAMGVLGRTFAQEAFSWGKIAQQTIEVYRWVLGQGNKPDCIRAD